MAPLPIHLRLDEPAVYRIFVQGRLDPKWFSEYPDMEITRVKLTSGMTLTYLTGLLADQASLHGLLNQIRDFGWVLVGLSLVDFDLTDATNWSKL